MRPECERVMDSLGENLPPALATHAATCADCQAFLSSFETLDAIAPSPSPAKTPGMEAARRKSMQELALKPRATPWWRELLVLLGTYAVVMVGGVVGLGRNGLVLNTASPLVIAGVGFAILVLVTGGAYVAMAPARRHVPWLIVAAVAGAVSLLLVMGGSGYAPARGFLAGLVGCVTSEVVLSIPPLALALVLLCRSAFQPVRAFAAGLSAAGVSLFVLHLHCPDGTAGHLMLGHLVPWLLLAGVALFLRARLPTRSYSP